MKKLLSVISVLVALAVLVLVVFNPVAGIARTTWLWLLLVPVVLIVGNHIYDFIKRHQARKESMNTLDDDDEEDAEEELVEEEKPVPTKLTLSRREEIRRRKEVAEEALAEIIAMADKAGEEVDSLTSSLKEEDKKVANALKAAEAARAALKAASKA